jgi:hypothetical protein
VTEVKKISRREFAALSAVLVASPSFAASNDRLILLGGESPRGEVFGLSVFDKKLNAQKNIISPVQIHSIATVSSQPDVIALIAKNRKLSARYDFSSGKAETFAAERGQFSGHGVILPQTQELLTSEFPEESEEGFIVGRDLKSLKVTRIFSSGGFGPHELQLTPEGHLLAANGSVANGSNFSVMDVKSGKVLEQIAGKNNEQRVRHFVIDADGTIIVAGWPNEEKGSYKGILPEILVAKLGKDKKFESISSLAGAKVITQQDVQFLSIAASPDRKRVAVTAPAYHRLVLLENRVVTHELEVPMPYGVSFLDAQTLLCFSKYGEVFRVNLAAAKPEVQKLSKASHYFGPHVTKI